MLPFEAGDGTSYYDYRAWITVGILVNTLLTLIAEKIVARTITAASDQRQAAKKRRHFNNKMLGYLSTNDDRSQLATGQESSLNKKYFSDRDDDDAYKSDKYL